MITIDFNDPESIVLGVTIVVTTVLGAVAIYFAYMKIHEKQQKSESESFYNSPSKNGWPAISTVNNFWGPGHELQTTVCFGNECDDIFLEAFSTTERFENFMNKFNRYASNDTNMQSLIKEKPSGLASGFLGVFGGGPSQYHVQKHLPNTDRAAALIKQIDMKNRRLIDILRNKYPSHDATKTLLNRYSSKAIFEAHPETGDNGLTSYTTDKKLIGFCVRNESDPSDFIDDINLLAFVSIHELAHMASHTSGHNEEFRKNFYWLLRIATDNNIYKPVDYSRSPVNYCGLELKTSPLF